MNVLPSTLDLLFSPGASSPTRMERAAFVTMGGTMSRLRRWTFCRRIFNLKASNLDAATYGILLAFYHQQGEGNVKFILFFPDPTEVWPLTHCGTARVATITGITKGADTIITAANNLVNIATDVYVYLKDVVSDHAGIGPYIDTVLNGSLHKVSEFTGAAACKIATDTSACTDVWTPGGTAAPATYVIPAKSCTSIVVKDNTTTKTVDTDYDIISGGGVNGEDVIQLEEVWAAALTAGHIIYASFTGKRRYDDCLWDGVDLPKNHDDPLLSSSPFTIVGVEKDGSIL